MVASEISGANQRRNGPIKRDVCSAERRSVDPTKIKIIQATTGNQYLRNARTKNETTGVPIVLISRGDETEAHSAPGVRTAVHGAGLGRAARGIALRQTTALRCLDR